MLGALTGFVTIGVVIGVGILVAHLGLFDLRAQQVLSRLAFFVGSPCLMALTISEADVAKMLSANLIASAGSVVVAGGGWILLARLLFKSDAGETTIGALSSAYVNAGNLGIPIAAYALGDAALVAPTLLMQLIVIQPLAMVVLDRHTRGGGGVRRVLVTATTNPLTIGSLIGLLMALTGLRLPTMIHAPVELLAELAVPAMLLGYGIALRLGPGLGAGIGAKLWATCTLKLVVQPVVAWAIAAGLLGAQGVPLLAIVVTAALPTAQNIFVHATRYDVATGLARDTILLTTLGSVPVILLAVLLLS
ncbi:hypothetical protein BJY21_001744 [Kineosphaera limosa]|uniref:Putative AEC family transporter n=1 Tax=Kineosphaera limosa NBRC 100340 TaxID=1184609 RepID=K6X838_9MICO|nr:AEC family transporter [Kineosphaera limosa]NYE00560.1 hypothetical protein [Kineosphaera limosa]GAB94974.1 putative AEC family transporter [Kineosphaera limosa NBRC 100340]